MEIWQVVAGLLRTRSARGSSCAAYWTISSMSRRRSFRLRSMRNGKALELLQAGYRAAT